MVYRKRSMASAIALAVCLTACGGGGGGGPRVASIPNPPPTPEPVRTPPGTVGAPAMGVVPNATLFPPAVNGGPTMQQHPTTAFPLLQSVITTANGQTAAADTAIMNGGATLTFDSSPSNTDHHYKLSVPALGFADLALVAGGWYCYSLCGYTSRGGQVSLSISDPADSDLSWTTYGSWDAYDSPNYTLGYFVTGYETPLTAVPKTGSATYNGKVDGIVVLPETSGLGFVGLSGNAAIQANFGSNSLSGNLTNMTVMGSPWNSVSLSGSISSGQNSFSGTSATTAAPAGPYSLSGTATGTFAGRFFGPAAQELGAIWTLHDGRAGAVGTIVAKGQ